MILVALIVGVLAFLLICVIAVVVHHERMKSFNQKVKEIHQQKLSSDELLKDGFRLHCPLSLLFPDHFLVKRKFKMLENLIVLLLALEWVDYLLVHYYHVLENVYYF